jgi:hypothetical protein
LRTHTDISTALHLSKLEEIDLRWLLLDFFHGALYDDSEAGVVFYPERNSAAVKLIYTNGSHVQAVAGPSLTDGALKELRHRIETEILAPQSRRIGREIFLSEKRVQGTFRYIDLLQILPVPQEAPHADLTLPGMFPRHPFVLEFSFEASPNQTLSGLRKYRIRCELELVLNALLDGLVQCRTPVGGRYRWILSPSQDPQHTQACTLAQEGYACSGFPSEHAEFSDPSSLLKLPEFEPSMYYELSWGPGMSLGVPSNIATQLDRFCSLPREERKIWLNACHWLRHSSVTVWDSRSAAFIALVTAVEALMSRKDRGNRRKFEAFIDRFAPGRGLQQDRSRFYRIRSELAHGAELHDEDRDWLQVSVTPAMSEGFRQFEAMRRVARSVAANWLATNDRSRSSSV